MSYGYANFLQKLVVKPQYDSKAVYYFMHWNYVSKQVLKFQQQTTGIINFQLADYMQFGKIYFPQDLHEQRRIAEVLQACDHEIALLERKRDLLTQQKQGLMQQLLTGRVRVPVAQVEP